MNLFHALPRQIRRLSSAVLLLPFLPCPTRAPRICSRSKPILLALASVAGLALAPAYAATIVTVGDTDPPFDNGIADSWDAVFVFNTALVAPNPTDTFGQVTQFEFWADNGTAGHFITPLLFSSTDGGASHTVAGIGTTYIVAIDVTAEAVNAVPFGLVSGDDTFDTTTPGTTYYLGFHSTNNDFDPASIGGVVPFAGTGGGPNILWQTESIPGVGQNANTGSSDTFSSNRQYAYNFDITYVPEPTGVSLIALGALSLFFGRRRRA